MIKDAGWDADNFRLAASRIQQGNRSTQDVERALAKLGKAMALVDIPTPAEIANFRLAQLKVQFGLSRFLNFEWWQWLYISCKD